MVIDIYIPVATMVILGMNEPFGEICTTTAGPTQQSLGNQRVEFVSRYTARASVSFHFSVRGRPTG